MQVVVGNNGSCDAASVFGTLSGGGRLCAPPGALHNPAIVFAGTPTRPTCSPQYTTSGSLTPSGQQTICCR
jgi:hypothetical protein